MTVPLGEVYRTNQVGNGAVVAFSFNFTVLTDEDVDVYVVTTATGATVKLVKDVGYTIVLNTSSPGGVVTYTVAPTALEESLIILDMGIEQPVGIPATGGARDDQLEVPPDRLTLIVGQLLEKFERALLSNIADPGTNLTLPSPVADKVLGWDPTGLFLENLDNPTDSQIAAAASAAAALVSEIAAELAETNAETAQTAAEAAEAAIVPQLTNKSGAGLVLGDVVIADAANDDSVTTTTTQADPLVVGVAAATIANNGTGDIRNAGVIDVNIKGTVVRGHFIRAAAFVKQAEDAGTTVVDGVFGIALAGGTDELVSCLVFNPTQAADGQLSADDLAAIEDAPGTPSASNTFLAANEIPISKGAVTNQRIIHGRIDGNGTILTGTGFTVSGPTLSQYDITAGTSFGTIPSVVPVVEVAADATIRLARNVDTTVSVMKILTITDGVGKQDLRFHFQAVG